MKIRTLMAAALVALAPVSAVADEAIIVQSTTSTANSGLYDYLLPIFTDKTGIAVNVVAVGTGQAIKNAANCDGDVLLVHAKPAEEKKPEPIGPPRGSKVRLSPLRFPNESRPRRGRVLDI